MDIGDLVQDASRREGANLLGVSRIGTQCAVILVWAGDGHRELPTLDDKTERIARKIRSKGFIASLIGSMDGKGISLRKLAHEAGLGFLGRSGLLVTERFGPEVRLTGIITDAEIETEAKEKGEFNGCSGCSICVKACPAGAIEGRDPAACRKFVENLNDGRCTVCIDVCPFGGGSR